MASIYETLTFFNTELALSSFFRACRGDVCWICLRHSSDTSLFPGECFLSEGLAVCILLLVVFPSLSQQLGSGKKNTERLCPTLWSWEYPGEKCWKRKSMLLTELKQCYVVHYEREVKLSSGGLKHYCWPGKLVQSIYCIPSIILSTFISHKNSMR